MTGLTYQEYLRFKEASGFKGHPGIPGQRGGSAHNPPPPGVRPPENITIVADAEDAELDSLPSVAAPEAGTTDVTVPVRKIRKDVAPGPSPYQRPAHAIAVEKGGPGSGNFGHEGRPGQVGGSGPAGAETGTRGFRRAMHEFFDPKSNFAKMAGHAGKATLEGAKAAAYAPPLAVGIGMKYPKIGAGMAAIAGLYGASLGLDFAKAYYRHKFWSWMTGQTDGPLQESDASADVSGLAQEVQAELESLGDQRDVAIDLMTALAEQQADGGDAVDTDSNGLPRLSAEKLQELGIDEAAAEQLTPLAVKMSVLFAALVPNEQPRDIIPVEKGGPGSGNFGHEGRPGQIGGSAPSDGDDDVPERDIARELVGAGASIAAGIKGFGLGQSIGQKLAQPAVRALLSAAARKIPLAAGLVRFIPGPAGLIAGTIGSFATSEAASYAADMLFDYLDEHGLQDPEDFEVFDPEDFADAPTIQDAEMMAGSGDAPDEAGVPSSAERVKALAAELGFEEDVDYTVLDDGRYEFAGEEDWTAEDIMDLFEDIAYYRQHPTPRKKGLFSWLTEATDDYTQDDVHLSPGEDLAKLAGSTAGAYGGYALGGKLGHQAMGAAAGKLLKPGMRAMLRAAASKIPLAASLNPAAIAGSIVLGTAADYALGVLFDYLGEKGVQSPEDLEAMSAEDFADAPTIEDAEAVMPQKGLGAFMTDVPGEAFPEDQVDTEDAGLFDYMFTPPWMQESKTPDFTHEEYVTLAKGGFFGKKMQKAYTPEEVPAMDEMPVEKNMGEECYEMPVQKGLDDDGNWYDEDESSYNAQEDPYSPYGYYDDSGHWVWYDDYQHEPQTIKIDEMPDEPMYAEAPTAIDISAPKKETPHKAPAEVDTPADIKRAQQAVLEDRFKQEGKFPGFMPGDYRYDASTGKWSLERFQPGKEKWNELKRQWEEEQAPEWKPYDPLRDPKYVPELDDPVKAYGYAAGLPEFQARPGEQFDTIAQAQEFEAARQKAERQKALQALEPTRAERLESGEIMPVASEYLAEQANKLLEYAKAWIPETDPMSERFGRLPEPKAPPYDMNDPKEPQPPADMPPYIIDEKGGMSVFRADGSVDYFSDARSGLRAWRGEHKVGDVRPVKVKDASAPLPYSIVPYTTGVPPMGSYNTADGPTPAPEIMEPYTSLSGRDPAMLDPKMAELVTKAREVEQRARSLGQTKTQALITANDYLKAEREKQLAPVRRAPQELGTPPHGQVIAGDVPMLTGGPAAVNYAAAEEAKQMLDRNFGYASNEQAIERDLRVEARQIKNEAIRLGWDEDQAISIAEDFMNEKRDKLLGYQGQPSATTRGGGASRQVRAQPADTSDGENIQSMAETFGLQAREMPDGRVVLRTKDGRQQVFRSPSEAMKFLQSISGKKRVQKDAEPEMMGHDPLQALLTKAMRCNADVLPQASGKCIIMLRDQDPPHCGCQFDDAEQASQWLDAQGAPYHEPMDSMMREAEDDDKEPVMTNLDGPDLTYDTPEDEYDPELDYRPEADMPAPPAFMPPTATPMEQPVAQPMATPIPAPTATPMRQPGWGAAAVRQILG